VATLVANTTRICIALEMQRRGVEVDGLSWNQLHRVEGVVIYFGFLLLLFMLSERIEGVKTRTALLFPLAIYYVTTLGIPLLNGSYRQGMPFWEHFAFVLVLPLVVVVPFIVIQQCLNFRGSMKNAEGVR
jgi:membrane protein YdbS with pleckstrin-like domain